MRPLLLLLLLAGFVSAAEPTPPAPEIRLPVIDPPPSPMPMAPAVVTKLSGAQLFVIDSNVKLQVAGSRDGLVSITPEAGPLRIRGVFVDDPTGKAKTKTFKGPFLYIVEAKATGEVELMIFQSVDVPVIRSTLDVDAGGGPQPPPVVPTDDFTKAILAAFAKDTGTDKLAQAGKLASLYRAAAKTTVSDATVKTYADLYADMLAAGKGTMPATALAGVRMTIEARLMKSLAPPASPIDRTLAAKEIAAVADALAACK